MEMLALQNNAFGRHLLVEAACVTCNSMFSLFMQLLLSWPHYEQKNKYMDCVSDVLCTWKVFSISRVDCLHVLLVASGIIRLDSFKLWESHLLFSWIKLGVRWLRWNLSEEVCIFKWSWIKLHKYACSIVG